MLCAVDLGGTKTKIGLYDPARLQVARETATFASGEFRSFDDLIQAFLKPRKIKLEALAIGVAGPANVTEGEVTNLNWRLQASSLAALVDCPEVMILNDLEAHAWGIPVLTSDGQTVVRAGTAKVGNQALIAAGTGLGESILFWDGTKHVPRATEGGHCSFSPTDEREIELLQFLWRSYPVVSWERVVSGSFGFRHLYQFLASKPEWTGKSTIAIDANNDFGPQMADAARKGCPLSLEAVRWFMRLYGAETGNLALKAWALGGIYIGGGIAAVLKDFLLEGDFAAGFANKGRFNKVLNDIPITLITDPDCALKGAAYYAQHHRRNR